MQHTPKTGLCRAELMQLLCRIAVARRAKHGIKHVPDALRILFDNIRANASREVLQDSMQFRRKNCYTEETDEALRLHEPCLRLLFRKYSHGETVVDDTCGAVGRIGKVQHARTTKYLAIGDWIALARDCGLLDDDLTLADAKIIFLWSRTRVVDEDNVVHRQRVEHLTWWAFLEAMVRTAHMKALPTHSDVEASGCADGGEFILKLKRSSPTNFKRFVMENCRAWWEPLTTHSISDKLGHLLMLFSRNVIDNLTRISQMCPHIEELTKVVEQASADATSVRRKSLAAAAAPQMRRASMTREQVDALGDALDKTFCQQRSAVVLIQQQHHRNYARWRLLRNVVNLGFTK